MGVDRNHADRLIKQDGLPVVMIPTAQGIKRKVAISAFHRWLSSRSSNVTLTLEELQDELGRVASTHRKQASA